MDPYVLDVSRLVNDIKGYIAQLKTAYFENKEPVDDNEIVLQKLCVKLETALRNGMKDKYTFLGMRKDYWNFIAECLPKDEGVRYVNSLSQLQTVQGKGRALIRYCLVQKTLADTIQRTLMHKKRVEWYTPEALLLSNSLSTALIGKLYDLNELEFHLSCTGCDLDMSWPSFSGRSLTDGYDKWTRRNSAGSVASTTDFTNERIDPLIALNAEISALKQMISRELDHERNGTDDGIGECSMSSIDDAQPNIGDITLEISRLHHFILKWKSLMDAKMYKAEHEIDRLLEEKERVTRDSNAQLAHLAERHQNLSDLASKEATLRITDLQNKLRNAETAITEHKKKVDSLSEEISQISKDYEHSQQAVTDIRKRLHDSQENSKKLQSDICILKENIETKTADNRNLAEKNNSLKTELWNSQQSESLLRIKLEESESKLNIKTLEKEKVQEAFENVNGLVFSSFEDFESYYKSQLLDKEKGLEVKDTENRTLQQRLLQLTSENEKLKNELQESLGSTKTSHEGELAGDAVKAQKHEDQSSESKLVMNFLMETIEKANVILSKWLHNGRDNNKEMQSIEQQCESIVNNLDELGNQLRIDKEYLATVVDEKEKLDTQCQSLSLEVKRLLQLNCEMENEKAVVKQSEREEKKKLEDELRVLKEEKTTLQDTINALRKEILDVDSKVKEVNDKLQEENYLKLALENEVSEITEQLTQVKNEQAVTLEESERLNLKIEETNNKCKQLEDELIKCNNERESATSALSKSSNELANTKEMLEKSEKETGDMKIRLKDYEEQLANLQCTMDQHVSSLKFQLSSEALKYDEEIKTLSKEKQEAISLWDKIQENEEVITELENTLKERNETWQVEKKKLTGDIKLLKNEIKVLNGNIDAGKQQIQSMENTLALSKKKCEKEKGRNLEYRKKIKEMKNQKSENEMILEQEKSELEEDIKQLKTKMISLLSDKSELWKRSAQLEYDMKTRLSETWVEDKDVRRCPQCNTEFTMFVRKHHCRFCGNVFCHNCSDNFVKTIHSRKPYRSCTSCYKKEKEQKTDTSWLASKRPSQDDINLSIGSQGSDTEGDLTSSPSKIEKDVSQREKTLNEQVDHDDNDHSDGSDDSDEHYQVIEESEDSLRCGSLQNDRLSITHSTRLRPGNGTEEWSEAVIPAGKRYLVNVEVLAGSQLLTEFTTSEQNILFGAAVQDIDSSSESKTLIPLCQINSHDRNAKKRFNVASSGLLMLVFDNTHFKSSTQKLRFKIYRSQETVE